ncbi:MAG: glycerate kinase [Chthonomonadaceae bacterium]|nr:glycerate kinase [Chthonomonadaceae bacterium]
MSMMSRFRRILICPNAFKGSLTASDAARAMAEGAARAGAYETICLPLADGGDGTLETLVEATGGSLHSIVVQDPLGRPVAAAWGRLGGSQSDTAVIEMAQASGLRLLRSEERDPLHASTFGTGELMRHALQAGCRKLLVGIGGSATNDGGAGMAQALGFRLLDAAGKELPPGGSALARLARIETDGSRLPPNLEVVVACDVDNPLCGPDGAAAIYGPQKGATPKQVQELDAALAHYADVLHHTFGSSVAEVPGAGAAGGLGAGLMAFCGARLQSGAEMVLDVTGFDALLADCDLVLTGEGRIDGQTARGKVIAGVARRAKAAGVPVVALAGSVAEGAEALLRPEGLNAALSIVNGPLSVEEAMQAGYGLLGEAAERTMRILEIGGATR